MLCINVGFDVNILLRLPDQSRTQWCLKSGSKLQVIHCCCPLPLSELSLSFTPPSLSLNRHAHPPTQSQFIIIPPSITSHSVPYSPRIFFLFQALILYVQSLGYGPDKYEIVTNFPRRKISLMNTSLTIEALGFNNQEMLYVQEL